MCDNNKEIGLNALYAGSKFINYQNKRNKLKKWFGKGKKKSLSLMGIPFWWFFGQYLDCKSFGSKDVESSCRNCWDWCWKCGNFEISNGDERDVDGILGTDTLTDEAETCWSWSIWSRQTDVNIWSAKNSVFLFPLLFSINSSWLWLYFGLGVSLTSGTSSNFSSDPLFNVWFCFWRLCFGCLSHILYIWCLLTSIWKSCKE